MKTASHRFAAFLVAVAAVRAAAQDLTPRMPPQTQPVVIVNATIHPVSSPAIEKGALLFENGRITRVGAVDVPASGWTVIDAGGAHVYPGLIGAMTQLGLSEISSVRAMRDFDEIGDVSPEVRAAVAVNPDSTLIPVTRSNGILTAGVFPTGGTIPGRASVIQLDGWTYEDMTVEADAGLIVNWPAMRPARSRFSDRSDEEQLREIGEAIARIENTFRAAAAYLRARRADPNIPTDLRLEAMSAVLPPAGAPESRPAGESRPSARRPVFVFAEDYDQISAAVSFGARHGLRVVLVGGRDAPLHADLLVAHGVSVIVNGTFQVPRRADSPYDDAYTLPARLEGAGIRWCLASGDDTAHERNLPYGAAIAVAHGLSRDAALRGITLSAAEILGVADRVGSLDVGKAATLMITDGDPLEITTRVRRAFIAGREVDLSNKQTRLSEKYRAKYREQGR